jgi:hypothetical protein
MAAAALALALLAAAAATYITARLRRQRHEAVSAAATSAAEGAEAVSQLQQRVQASDARVAQLAAAAEAAAAAESAAAAAATAAAASAAAEAAALRRAGYARAFPGSALLVAVHPHLVAPLPAPGAPRPPPGVLGYGSHGTVVLEGVLGGLDGRPVAVKRMLKVFHKNAARETALLVSSDGHPNICRYFAREDGGGGAGPLSLPGEGGQDAEAGDIGAIEATEWGPGGDGGEFVYLALERCDASVFDAVETRARCGRVRREAAAGGARPAPPAPPLPESARRFLRELASGVAHLHR